LSEDRSISKFNNFTKASLSAFELGFLFAILDFVICLGATARIA